jgi:hypothetical protein
LKDSDTVNSSSKAQSLVVLPFDLIASMDAYGAARCANEKLLHLFDIIDYESGGKKLSLLEAWVMPMALVFLMKLYK